MNPMDDHTGPVPSPLGSSREALLSAVRAALGGRTAGVPEPPHIDDSLVRLASQQENLAARFAAGAEAVGMVVHRLTDADLEVCLQALAIDHGVKSCVVGFADPSAGRRIVTAMEGHGVCCVRWQEAGGVDAQFDVDLAITDVHAALAETGTLVCCSDAAHGRCLSLVAPVHVAVVRANDLVPDMMDYWAGCDTEALPSSISFITGPSKTADIEGILITGVHGPGTVHILMVDLED